MMFPGIRFARRARIHMCATRSPEISVSSGFGLDTRWGVWTAATNQASIKFRKEMFVHRKTAASEQVMPPCRRTKRRTCGNSAVVVKEWFGLGKPKPYLRNLPSRWDKSIGAAGSCCGVVLGRRCPLRRHCGMAYGVPACTATAGTRLSRSLSQVITRCFWWSIP